MGSTVNSIIKSPGQWFWALICVGILLACYRDGYSAQPGGFAGGVTPSRFEISASAGDLVRRSIKIYNLGVRPTQFIISTVDWNYSETGQITFQNPLIEKSCRPWVRLERHKISVVPDPRRPRNFRFEMHVPEDAPRQECRFAVMMESLGESHQTELQGGAITLPVTGRIAVIVYLQIGDVAPELVLEKVHVKTINTKRLPVVRVSNRRDAHGRLDGELTGKDANGEKLKFSVVTSPILPGQTREMVLTPVDIKKDIVFPVSISGKIYADNATFKIDTQLK